MGRRVLLLLSLAGLLGLGSCRGGDDGGSPTPPDNTPKISGQITAMGSPLAGVTVQLSGAATAERTTGSDGRYSFTGLASGEYTVTPVLSGQTFTPASALVTTTGSLSFEHFQTGNGTLGNVTLTSVTWNSGAGHDALSYFEVTSPPVDGAGTLRARASSEIAGGLLADYTDMWSAANTVTIAITSDLGVSTIVLVLGTYPAFNASSAEYFMHGSFTTSVSGVNFIRN